MSRLLLTELVLQSSIGNGSSMTIYLEGLRGGIFRIDSTSGVSSPLPASVTFTSSPSLLTDIELH